MGRTSVGLRTRLMLLVLVAVIPAFGMIWYTTIKQRQQAAADAERDTMNLVRLVAEDQSELMDSAEQLLISLSQMIQINQANSAECSRFLGDIQKTYPSYTNLGVASLDGNVWCSALPLKHPVSIADRSYFRRALKSLGFGVGDYQTGRITGINAINFGYPVFDRQDKPRDVVYAALDLAWLNRLIETVDLPAGANLTVVDSGGTILYRYPETQRWQGKSVRGSSFMRMIYSHRQAGTAQLKGMDGIDRLYAFAPLFEKPAGNVYVSVGMPTALAFATVRASFQHNVNMLLVVLAMALVAAWVGGDVFVLRRVRALDSAVQRLGKGDLGARTGLPQGNDELGRLAQTFDHMALALQRMDRARKTLSAGNRTVVRAEDEQTLLEKMCRNIVEIGGYSCAWVGYAQQDDRKSIRPVAQAGFDGGLDALEKSLAMNWSDTELGRGPVGNAVRGGKFHVAQNILNDPACSPWRAEARKRGYAAVCAFPLFIQDQPGALAIYSTESDAFNEEEMELLAEAAEDLAFGITTIRTRAEHEQAHKALRRMAYYDDLTGLPNHVHLVERMKRTLTVADDGSQSVALFLIDIDRFREINDALGFQQGDILLKEVATRLEAVVDQEDMVTRMRGDEFAALLPVRDVCHAAETALRIIDALDAPFVVDNLPLHVSATIGISLYPQHGKDAMRLIRHADVAKHHAKKSGKHYAVYAQDKDDDRPEQLALAGELRRAIDEDGLVLHYQPKLEMATGRVCGVEALIRWMHPQRGIIPPDQFIPLAEHTGLIKPLTDWVLADVMRQSSLWRSAGMDLPIAVNLSARNLHDLELAEKVEQLLEQSGAAGWLDLEITESAVMEDPEGVLQNLIRLRDLGVALYIDDFGTGYSSLGYLKRLPVNSVKIDKSFVIDMLDNTDSAAIVRSTISLAHDLNLEVVAEGIESQAIWDQLAAQGCDVAQGYFISKPLPAAQFEKWYQQHAASETETSSEPSPA